MNRSDKFILFFIFVKYKSYFIKEQRIYQTIKTLEVKKKMIDTKKKSANLGKALLFNFGKEYEL